MNCQILEAAKQPWERVEQPPAEPAEPEKKEKKKKKKKSSLIFFRLQLFLFENNVNHFLRKEI